MKNNIKNLSKSKATLVLIALTLTILAISCSKKSNDIISNNFAGTYYGKLVNGAYNETDTITIPASSSSAIVMNTKTGIGSKYTINGTVSGSTLTIPSQSVAVSSLGGTYTVTGSGTLTNSTLVINYVFVTASNVTSRWTFTGAKN